MYFHEIVLVVSVVVWILIRKQKVVKGLLLKPIVTFSALALLSLILAIPVLLPVQLLVSFFYWLRWVWYAFVYFVVLSFPKEYKTKILHLLVFSGVIIAVSGIVQYFLYPNLRNLYYQGWDPHQYRLFSTFLDPNFVGIYLVLTLYLLAGFLRQTKNHAILYKTGILVTFIALLLTYSRASYLAFLVGVGIWSILQRAWKPLGILIVINIIGIAVLPHPFGEGVNLLRTSTIMARFSNYSEAFTIVSKNPVFGIGFNTYAFRRFSKPESTTPSHAQSGVDNSFLFVLATTGIVGLLSYLWILGTVYKGSIRLKDTLFRGVRLASMSAIIVHSLFSNTLFYPWIMLWMWTVWGATEELIAHR